MGIILIRRKDVCWRIGLHVRSLILHDDGQEVTEDKIKTLLSAAKVDVEAYWPGLFIRAFNDTEGGLDKLISTPAVGGGGGGAAPGADGAAAGGDDKPAAKKKSSSDDDMAAPAASIFGDDGGDDY